MARSSFDACLVKLTFEEIGDTHRGQERAGTLTRAQPQRGLEMLDREIGLAGK